MFKLELKQIIMLKTFLPLWTLNISVGYHPNIKLIWLCVNPIAMTD